MDRESCHRESCIVVSFFAGLLASRHRESCIVVSFFAGLLASCHRDFLLGAADAGCTSGARFGGAIVNLQDWARLRNLNLDRESSRFE